MPWVYVSYSGFYLYGKKIVIDNIKDDVGANSSPWMLSRIFGLLVNIEMQSRFLVLYIKTRILRQKNWFPRIQTYKFIVHDDVSGKKDALNIVKCIRAVDLSYDLFIYKNCSISF